MQSEDSEHHGFKWNREGLETPVGAFQVLAKMAARSSGGAPFLALLEAARGPGASISTAAPGPAAQQAATEATQRPGSRAGAPPPPPTDDPNDPPGLREQVEP